MSILDKLYQHQTGRKTIDEFRHIQVTQKEPRELEPAGFATQYEWELCATVIVTFRANQAQYNDARKVAEETLLSRMYGDIRVPLQEAKQAVSDGDRREAFKALAMIDKAIGA